MLGDAVGEYGVRLDSNPKGQRLAKLMAQIIIRIAFVEESG